MESIDWADDMSPATLFELPHEGLADLGFECSCNVLLLDANVWYAQHHIATEALNREEAAFLELVIQTQNASAGCIEVACVLKQMEADKIAKQQTA